MRAGVFVVSQERKFYTHRERKTVSLSGGASMSTAVCVGMREIAAFSHGRLRLGIAFTKKLSFLLLMRRELSLDFGPSHLQRLQEKVALQLLNMGSDQFRLTQIYLLQ